jgi:hypothetical protein
MNARTMGGRTCLPFGSWEGRSSETVCLASGDAQSCWVSKSELFAYRDAAVRFEGRRERSAERRSGPYRKQTNRKQGDRRLRARPPGPPEAARGGSLRARWGSHARTMEPLKKRRVNEVNRREIRVNRVTRFTLISVRFTGPGFPTSIS